VSTIQFFHALDRDGNLIGIDVADKKGNGPFKCPHCHREMVARNVKRDRQRFPHFAHKHIDGLAISPDCYDHEEHLVLQDQIMVAFNKHVSDREQYLARYRCDDCGTLVTVDVTRAGRVMEREAEFEGLRPDLLIRDGAGQVRCVIEIVIKHALSEENSARYTGLNVPVLVVYFAIPDVLAPLTRGADHAEARKHTREVVGEWLPVAKMLGKKSHTCTPRPPDRITETPDASKLEYTDDCQLAPIEQPVVKQDAVSGTKKKDNPFQVPLVPPRSRNPDSGAIALVDSALLHLAVKISEELHLTMQEENPNQAFCSVHQVEVPNFDIDIILSRCYRCKKEVRAMMLRSQSRAFYEPERDSERFGKYFLPPEHDQFIVTALRWGVSLEWKQSGIWPDGYLMTFCPNCSAGIRGFAELPCNEPFEYIIDHRQYCWCGSCGKYGWSGQLDDIAERLRQELLA
jgi:uncharacterized protein with PIN domain